MVELLEAQVSPLYEALGGQEAPAYAAGALVDFGLEGPRQTLACALELARGGQPEAALELLTPVAEGDEGLEPWLERLQEFAEAREKLINKVLGKTDLRLMEGGVQVELTVTAREEGRLVIEASEEHGLTELPLQRIDAGTLALNAKRSTTSFGPKWLPGFALWLEGDEGFSEALERAGRKLREELAGEPGLMGLGRGLTALQGARAAAGGSLAQLEDALGGLQASSGAFATVDDLSELRGTSNAAGAELLAALGPSRGFDALLEADVELLGEGRVRVVYDFAAGRGFDDFEITDDWFELGGGYPSAGLPESATPVLVPDSGLEFTGSHTLKHRLLFADDAAVELQLKYMGIAQNETIGVVLAGACVRPGRAWAVAWNFMLLQAIDGDRELSLSADADGLLAFPGKTYTYEFQLKGGELRMATRGTERAKLDVGEFKPGEVLFGARTKKPIVFERVTIEGRPFVEDMALLQRGWIARQTAQFFSL